MKKIIFIEFILLFFLCVFITFSVFYFQSYAMACSVLTLEPNNDFMGELARNNLIEALTFVIAGIFDIALIVCIVIFPLPGITPFANKYNAFMEKRKQAKSEKEEKNKQAKIADLEKQLSELKKDE